VKFLIGAVLAMVSASAFAQEESELALAPAVETSSFRYGMSDESYETANGGDYDQRWFSVRSGHLTGAIDSKMDRYSLRVNANGAEVVGLNGSGLWVEDVLKRFQVELGSASNKSAYGLFAVETSVVKPLNLFIGTIHNPGGNQRFVVGPILYWSKSHTMMLYYPKPSKSDTVVDNSIVVRNRIRENDVMWVDLDASYKQVAEDNKVDQWSPYGYGVSVGIWKFYVKLSQTPYYEGTKTLQERTEIGIDASF